MSGLAVPRQITALLALLPALTLGGRPVAAQIDYRNLDEGRPVRTEDAYPIERYAFELVVPFEYEDERGPERVHSLAPELSYGLLPNAMIGLKLPFTAVDGGEGAETRWGLAGPEIFALYNFNTESPALPAFALRADAALPLGKLAADDARGSVAAIATRSWGRTRIHLNAALGIGPESSVEAAGVHAIPAWSASAAVDRTFLRRSLLIIGEIGVAEAAAESGTEVGAALGGRMQITPTLVFDAGIRRRLTSTAGTDLGLTIGLSHAFALAGLMPPGRR